MGATFVEETLMVSESAPASFAPSVAHCGIAVSVTSPEK